MFISSFILLATSIVLSFAEDLSSNNPFSIKRAPMNFQGIRGKKDDLTSIQHGGLSKRTPMSFQSMRGKKDLINNEDNFPHEVEISDKRTLMGLQDMRGKNNFLIPDFEDAYFQDNYDKRAPMGFQGMRGKKAMSDDEYYKRAPMGFQGMRGKKSLEEVLEEIEKRTSKGFQGMRSKQTHLFDYPEEYEKRSLEMGFQGIHGKKEAFPMEWEKRAPMGFQGMRGKKALYDEMIEELEKRAIMGLQEIQEREGVNDNYVDYFLDPIDYEKRAPMGFQGMRGKKDSDKRAPMGFQGMRGKRNVIQLYGINGKTAQTEFQGDTNDRRDGISSYQFEKRSPFRYFGIRGKKNPRWEIRGKFVGVRGKKWATAPYVDNGSLKNVFDNIKRIDVKTGPTVALDVQ
ncbi:tachykinins-like isoform X1 [Vespa mandarinia]|uniref:tachykinins-like isoform X1 n=1 Tax=Vespa mandarinia TaxID=7446 RepID=UPI00160A1EB7|nr:tachykinins-like isoform X1 [Vespa mandarinia]XP_035719119.1 tachykinins-like isoform X1 [Vespa mandarinia]